ncbi:MAG: CDP-glucose 4,6-dehydratase, partial [Gammaproteobacteria bacterium]
HEAVQLKLDSTKAINRLNWSQNWNIEKALYKTVEWHLSWKKNKDMQHQTEAQIIDYTSNI